MDILAYLPISSKIPKNLDLDKTSFLKICFTNFNNNWYLILSSCTKLQIVPLIIGNKLPQMGEGDLFLPPVCLYQKNPDQVRPNIYMSKPNEFYFKIYFAQNSSENNIWKSFYLCVVLIFIFS